MAKNASTNIEPNYFWMHIPNTGSSFGYQLLRWACLPGVHYFASAAQVLTCRNGANFCGGGQQVDLFGHRFGIAFPKPTPNCTHVWQNWGLHATLFERMPHAKLKRILTMMRPNVKWDYRGDKQLRFILGHSAAIGNQPSFATACYRIMQFAFVGITDEWSASMCLFHRKFGGQYESFENEEVKSSIRKLQPKIAHTKKRFRPSTIDFELFKCVALRFGCEVRENDCAHYMTGTNYSDPYINTLLSSAEL